MALKISPGRWGKTTPNCDMAPSELSYLRKRSAKNCILALSLAFAAFHRAWGLSLVGRTVG